ncbi:helix-turn-helix domain-containing protein [Chitinispirillales bacterium ANBcel5]|uniref:hypothetical protein n=1 Tax=Cellulosispirillum alkaliphilum TaxID=3039283 RepID=UPI002A4EC924|nr:helix-turn-helix domain-containing protein [Chitinispirillales bacterium ANBcel5]
MPRVTKTELLRLQKKFKTDARIGDEFGITRQAIHQLRKKYGIPSRTSGNPERNQQILTMRDKGASVEAIARKFKLSIPQTYRIIKESSAPPRKKATKKSAAKKTSVKKSPAKKSTAKKKKATKKKRR